MSCIGGCLVGLWGSSTILGTSFWFPQLSLTRTLGISAQYNYPTMQLSNHPTVVPHTEVQAAWPRRGPHDRTMSLRANEEEMMSQPQRIGDVDLSEVLELSKHAVLEAGKIVSRAWGPGTGRSTVEATKSGTADLVTVTDQQCEEIISRLIKERFPSHVIIGEETVGDTYSLTNEPTWTIDPVDGTTNFVHRWPWTAILISFIVDKEVLVAVTYDAISDELYWATKGGGSFLKSPRYEGPIQTSGTQSIDKSVVIMEVGYRRDPLTVSQTSHCLAGLMQKNVRSVRMAGSCGLNIAAVASGKIDAYFEEGSWELNSGTKIWDFAGGKLLVEEAGGVIMDPSGAPFDLMGRNVFVAASAALADELREVLQEAKAKAEAETGGAG